MIQEIDSVLALFVDMEERVVRLVDASGRMAPAASEQRRMEFDIPAGGRYQFVAMCKFPGWPRSNGMGKATIV